jgi:autotransporter-associated beta strand protein
MKATCNLFTAALFGSMLVSPLALAQTSTSTTGNNTWSSGTGWSALPASGNATILTLGNGTSLAASAVVTSYNDIAGVFKLNGLNMTYAGPATGTAPTVTISGNQLEFTNNATAVAPTMVFNTTGAVKPSVTISNNILFTNTATINSTTDAILSGTLSGTGGFAKSGNGTLRVTNAATASGGTALGNIGVSAGILQIGNNGGYGSLGNGTITLSGSGSFAVARASNSFNLDNTITGSTSGAVNFNLNNTSGSFAVTLTKASTYTAATNLLPFSATSVGTPTLKNGITDALSTTTAFSINTVSGATANMTYDLNGFDQTIGSLASGAGVITTNGIVTNSGAAKTLTISSASGSTTYNGTISGAIALAKSGASTQVLSSTNNSYTGNTTVNGGTLSLTGSLSGGGAIFTSSTGILTQGAASVISGASTVTQGSSGTSILAGNNSYSGLTTVNSGVLQVNHANALGTSAAGTTVNGSDGSTNFLGTVLDLNGVAIGSGEALNLASGNITNNRLTLRAVAGTTNSWAGNVVLSGDKIVQLQTNNSTAQLTVSGGLSGPSFAGSLNLRGQGAGTLSGGVSLASTNNIQILDGGTWNINTANNTWGGTTISNGILVTGASNALPNSQFVTFGNAANSGLLKLNGFDQIVGGLAVSGTGTANKVVNGSSTAITLTVTHALNNSIFSGVLGGTGTNENNFGLTKSGASTLTLNGTNTYTGATLISGGKLALGASGSIDNTSSVSLGAVGTFDVSAKSGGYTVGVLKGSGNVTGALAVSSQLAIGNSAGTATFSSSLVLGASSTYLYELTGGAAPGLNSADLGKVTGDLTITSGSILDLVQLGTYTDKNKFTLFAYNGTLTGTFRDTSSNVLANGATFTDAGGIWTINYNDATAGANGGVSASNTYITISAVPEPNVVALLGGFGMLALLRRRRHEMLSFRSK